MDERLLQVIKENNINDNNASIVEKTFSSFFLKAKDLQKQSFEIVVTSEDQTDEMKKAGIARKELKKIRCEADKTRKNILEDSKLFTDAVNATYKYLENSIKKSEKHLDDQEKFIENLKKERLDLREEKRVSEMSKYECDCEDIDIRNMSEEGYQKQLTMAKSFYENLVKEREEEERKRLEEIEKEKAENERIRIENEELKKEAEKQAKIEAKRKTEEEKKRLEYEKKLEEERKEREKLLKIEREKQAKIEAELRAKKEEEEKKRIEEQKIIQAQKEAERQKSLAPDKDKLNELAIYITSIKMPELKSEKAKKIISDVVELLNKTSNYIKSNVVKI
jgi:hypothetical protein